MTVVLEARELYAGYGTNAKVVRGIDLAVRRGEVVALLGANGAGKTTLLRTLSGDLSCLSGDVFVSGRRVDTPLFRRARDGLAFITDERAVLMSLTVAENLRVGRGDGDLALALFPDLVEHLDRRVGLLSGGQQQMLALANALSRRPSIILADELSLGLAPKIVDRLLQVLREAADGGAGVLLVEQHVHKALAIADRVYVMQRGEVQIHGTSSELVDRIDEIQQAYLSLGGTDAEAS